MTPRAAAIAATVPGDGEVLDVGAALRREMGLLTEDEMAAALGVVPRTLANWRSERIAPPHVKVGAVVLYPKEDVIRWMRERIVSPDGRL